MEISIAEKKQKIIDIEPGFADLEKAFEERTKLYEKQKKDIVGMWCQSFTARRSRVPGVMPL
ncbi:hypothetical protein DPMN_098886 [Dreissena polymorpha]|uniref:Uncharacterized protein n=1 Tax=Dreissena polymorpha TaxID=45954 RepID=A0A9D4LDW8_DREPO|nr:hypothetical protein DPMN_098886 [Dreissena polymorpha]